MRPKSSPYWKGHMVIRKHAQSIFRCDQRVSSLAVAILTAGGNY